MVWQVWEGEGEVQLSSQCKINCAALCEGAEGSDSSKAGLESALPQPNSGRRACAQLVCICYRDTSPLPVLICTKPTGKMVVQSVVLHPLSLELKFSRLFYLLCFLGILAFTHWSGLHCSSCMQEAIITEGDQNSANECI